MCVYRRSKPASGLRSRFRIFSRSLSLGETSAPRRVKYELSCPSVAFPGWPQTWKPGILRDFSEHGKLREFWATLHYYIRLTTLFPGLPRWIGNRKVKPIWILLKQETMSGRGISWAICKSAPRSRQITMPAPARWYASAVLAMGLCPSVSVSVCLSQVGVLLKRLNVGSHKQHHMIAQGL